MKTNLLPIQDENLSRAWAKAFLKAYDSPGGEIVPMLVSIAIEDGNILEDDTVRSLLDAELASNGMASCATVAGTIFPRSMWNPDRPASDLFKRYENALPQIKKTRQNSYGTYFERLISHGAKNSKGFNQLQFIIDTRQKSGNMRRSALQASIVEPSRDLTNQRQRGFPCLQQVSFAPYGDNNMSVNGFYGTQYIFEKAYGNYLGLFDLGTFVAHSLGLRLTQLNCFTGIAELGITKKKTATLKSKLEKIPSLLL